MKETKKILIKTGDRVKVIAGKDKGKIGNVKKVLKDEGKLIVEGVNMVTKAQKANPMAGVQAGLNKKEAAIEASNVMVICPVCEKTTRISHKTEKKDKFRVCKKCGEKLDV